VAFTSTPDVESALVWASFFRRTMRMLQPLEDAGSANSNGQGAGGCLRFKVNSNLLS
jgi:hypothetical protein